MGVWRKKLIAGLKYDGAEGWSTGKTGKEDETPIAIQKAMLYAF